MIPISLFTKIVTDAALSGVVAYTVKEIINRVTKKVFDKAAEKTIETTTKVAKKIVKKENNIKQETKEAAETVKEVTKKTVENPPIDEFSRLRYCVLLSYAYGKYNDEELLKILMERGCIEEEDLTLLEEELKKLKPTEQK